MSRKIKSKQNFQDYYKQLTNQEKNDIIISVCCGTGCRANGALKVVDAFKKQIKEKKLNIKISTKSTGCHGFCEKGPLIVIFPKKIFYQKVNERDVPEIIEQTILNNKIIDRLAYHDPETKEKILIEEDIPFYKKQKRIIFSNNGKIDPLSIDDYISKGGYQALLKALFDMTSEEIIKELTVSKLRGRGGGGFLTARKWESCKNSKGQVCINMFAKGVGHRLKIIDKIQGKKFVICNADEGDPGAFMDRSIIEGNPHSVIEGMIIGAYAIGSNDGYIYIRDEYPLAVETFTKAIKDAQEYGFLGENILGSGFNFNIRINRGGGAFVCGESTALMASIEGNVGEPRAKYVHTVDCGLYSMPTVLNNVETWANISHIINKGGEWFSGIGTESSKGTKVFSLVGKIKNTGLVEVPMGITLREMLYDIGGGSPNGTKIKAVQTGGPSGGCLIAIEKEGKESELLDLPVDFDALYEAGSMMGSGGMIVMDETSCMVDVAKYFLNFLKEESCGKCVPCREGIRNMLEIIDRIINGEGKLEDLDALIELGETVQQTSLCGLGQTAPNPLLSTIRYFRDEYEEHILNKKCRAGVCKPLITFKIDKEKCTGCGACAKYCSVNAITGEKKQAHTINSEICIKCGACFEVCKFNAVIKE